MTAGVLDRPVTGQVALDGGGTLEELLSSALSEARANGSTECPVCHARMSFTRASAREAECGGCGSRLS
jgi:transcription initiation factor IIE alpha subunit